VAGIVTYDVQGAFDGVLVGRLCHRLRQQGYPEQVVAWTRSLLSDRSAWLCLDGIQAPECPIYCGLPQGSPVSPILFLLYIEPVLQLGGVRYGYTDDGCILASGRSLSDCRASLQSALDQTLSWGLENGVVFDAEKTELQYFVPGQRSEIEPHITHRGTEICSKGIIKWLGVYFDRHLHFKQHIQKATVRA
jgi:hypothetical protein